ncbi:metallophosphoesterase [Bacillus sp. FJAT-47783]|uniref:metallophosphoesterase n=1 Tax=Bacillus sp. FJAT-47783 TaxID=2922712 RepID=UPI001FAC9ED2|nr:metallophosphoesterase [Bacillus sp. FJAT-47783]
MKVLIISDSHGQTDVLHRVKERHLTEVDAIIHCGDSELMKDDLALDRMIVVRGNCDFETSFMNDHIEQMNDIKFFVTHGHLYSVKSTLMKLKYKAEEVNANVVCFGHSHIAGAEMIDGILFINPGSISLPRMRKEKTYVILNIAKGQANVDFYDENGDLLTNMSTAFQYA